MEESTQAHGRYHYAETINFLFNARGSAQEARSLLMAAKDVQQIKLSTTVYEMLNQEYEGLIKGINGFISALRKKRAKVN
ncbi:four helix bundle protein [Candidatus Microgenomates bacterium]|nr:four helix bundle protein [Candidatus Microgenomates bacterium]